MTFIGDLRPFQQEALNRIVERPRMLLALPMGTGKTVTALAAIENLMETGVITEPGIILAGASLKYQWQAEIAKFTDSRAAVVLGSPAKRRKIYEDFFHWDTSGLDYLIVTYETMSNDSEIFSALPRGFVIADECFPAGTLVDTPHGSCPIESIREGDDVLSALGTGRVRRTVARTAEALVRVVLDDGSSFECTPDHQLFTAVGWRSAKVLSYGDLLVQTDEAVRLVRGGDACLPHLPVDSPEVAPDRAFLREVLLGEMEDVGFGQGGEVTYSFCAGNPWKKVEGVARLLVAAGATATVAPGQVILDSGVRREAAANVASQWQHDQGPQGKRFPAYQYGAIALGSSVGLGVESGSADWEAQALGVPQQLQGRSVVAGSQVGRRGGWELPSAVEAAGTGQKKGRPAAFARVVRVEAVESGSAGRPGRSSGAGQVVVYNLEVEGHPSYSVNGVLVHNCTALKGFRAQRTQRAKRLFGRTPVKIGLSGTPIENGKPEELFSIMEFIDPSVLGRFDLFDRNFIVRNSQGWADGYKNLGTLHKAMVPAMVRRSYDDPEISAELPTEILKDPLLIDLDSRTASLMRRVTRDLKGDIIELISTPGGANWSIMSHYGQDENQPRQWDERDALRGALMSKIVTARMLCDHPELVRQSAQRFADEDDRGGSAYAAHLVVEGHLDKITATPKLDALAGRLEGILADPESKIVIFSVFRGMLDLIQQRMSSVGSVVYHGGMNAEQRNAAKVQFQTDPDIRLFISSDAGGYGVDLPQANVLVNYDLPWAAGALDQRNARPRRVSSTWERIVIELLMIRDSLEEWQYGLLAHKAAVSQAILAGRGITRAGDVSVPLDTLLTHLEKRASK